MRPERKKLKKMKIANRIGNIEESKSVRLSSIIAKLRGEGKKIIGLNVGEPDFPTPRPIIEATQKALSDGHTRYSLVEGILELRTAVAKKIAKDSGMDIGAEHIFLGNGSKHILYNIFQAICNEGDEVIVPIPYWVTFPESIKLAGGIPKFVHGQRNQLDLVRIEKAINSKTVAIIINSPNNPTGAVYPEEDLRQLIGLAEKYDLYIISDEAYEALIYDGQKHTYMASFSPEAFKRTITVQSFSKSYCMTGFRLGYMVAAQPITAAINKLQGHLSGNNCTFAQYGALQALEMADEIISDMVTVMEKRRNLAYELTKEIFPLEKPGGAFYLFPNVEQYLNDQIKNDEDLAEYILKETGVALLPGTYFGAPNHLRICFASSDEDIINGLGAIKRLLCK
jgi:aspartate aminotransferase